MLSVKGKWWLKRWKWLAGGLGLAVGTFLLVSWLLFQHVPSWYRPIEIPLDRVPEIQSDLAHTADALNERMMRANAPFEFRITQDQVNCWMAAREEMWPLSREWLPPGVTDPFITIDADCVRLAATVQYGSVQTVISLRLAPEVEQHQIRLKLLEVSSGSLPIPLSWVEQQAVRFQSRRAGSSYKDISFKSLAAEGILLPNRGVWRHLDQHPKTYEVIGLRLEPGTLTATVRTLTKNHSTR